MLVTEKTATTFMFSGKVFLRFNMSEIVKRHNKRQDSLLCGWKSKKLKVYGSGEETGRHTRKISKV